MTEIEIVLGEDIQRDQDQDRDQGPENAIEIEIEPEIEIEIKINTEIERELETEGRRNVILLIGRRIRNAKNTTLLKKMITEGRR